MNNSFEKQKVAVVGSGIAGLVCAYFLKPHYDIKVFEKNNYIGGHSNTVNIDYNGKKIAVDTGFIVYNHKTYPNLKAFFELLKVDFEKSNMSFAVKIIEKNLEYAGTNLNSVFAQRKNLFNIKFIQMLLDILRFNKESQKLINNPANIDYAMSDFLKDLQFGDYFKKYYILPMASAIWSTPLDKINNYPAYSFINFFKNHGLLTVSDQPQWYTVSGGSCEYVKKVCSVFSNDISLNNPVQKISLNAQKKWQVQTSQGNETFDKVIIAAHADQALQMLENPSEKQRKTLHAFNYQTNRAILHSDSQVMPNNKRAWASWVYSSNKNSINNQDLSVSYWMNNLQNIDHNYPLFVTLNPNIEIKKDKIFAEFVYEHPIFNAQAVNMQNQIDSIQGVDNLFFAGAYQSFGFHEDGIASGIRVINKMNIKTPWQ